MLLLGTAATRNGTKRINSSRHAKNIHLSLVDLGKNNLFALSVIGASSLFKTDELNLIGAGYVYR